MPKGPRDAVTLTGSQRATLLAWSRSRTRSHALTQRAQIVLACADHPGAGDTAVAEQLGVSREMVATWRSRFLAEGLDGLADRPRSGRPRKADGEAVLRILVCLLGPPPGDGQEWSTRAMAAETGLSQATVSRVWRDHRLQIRTRSDGARSSFPSVEVRDLAGLFLDPPTRVLAVVARQRDATAPAPVNRLAIRARNLVAVAEALAPLRPPAAQPDPDPEPPLSAFLQSLDDAAPARADLYLLIESDSGDTARDAVDAWAHQHPRRHLLSVPTGSSWLDEAELLLTHTPPLGQGNATGYETSLPALRDALRAWYETWPRTATPFRWTSSTYDSTAAESGQDDVSTGAADPGHTVSDLSDTVVQYVLTALLAASLESGERVKEAPLAARLGISRRAVRKALRVLADEGLLDRLPGRGVAVPHVDITSVLDLYAVRSALGNVLLRRAAMLNPSELRSVRAALADVRAVARLDAPGGRAGAADLHFQDMLARAANLPQTSLFFQRLTLRLRMFIAVLGLDFAEAAAGLIAREDTRIFEAVRDGDGDEAARLWRVKVERSVRFMATQLPDGTFDPNLWATIAGKPERRAGDPRKTV